MLKEERDLLKIILCFLLLLGIEGVSSAAVPEFPGGHEVTAEYQRMLALTDQDFAGSIQELHRYRILFVPGLLTDLAQKFETLPLPQRLRTGVFKEQITFLKAAGIDAIRVPVRTVNSIQENAALILQSIQASDKPVILIGHSKGGLDIEEALRLNPEKVRAVILIQSPLFGSPLADRVMDSALLRNLAKAIAHSLSGDLSSVRDLRVSEREKYMDQNSSIVRSIVVRIPHLSLAGFKKRERKRYWDSIFAPIRNWMDRHYSENDGQVEWRSAVLPGSDFILQEGIDHQVPTMRSWFIDFDRVQCTKVLLMMALQRIRAD